MCAARAAARHPTPDNSPATTTATKLQMQPDDDEEDLAYPGMTGGQIVYGLSSSAASRPSATRAALLPVSTSSTRARSTSSERSEQCCGHAAEGYARSTGKTGVILTTSGPGLTNIITPLQDARGDSTPILALSGQVPTAAVGTDAFQECLAVDLTRPCTKWSYQVKSVEEVRSVVHEAFRVASTGKRGPSTSTSRRTS